MLHRRSLTLPPASIPAAVLNVSEPEEPKHSEGVCLGSKIGPSANRRGGGGIGEISRISLIGSTPHIQLVKGYDSESPENTLESLHPSRSFDNNAQEEGEKEDYAEEGER